MKRFCPKCGKEINSDDMIHNFCINCYLEDNNVIIAPIFKITICPKCKILKYAKKSYKKIESLELELEKHVKVKELKQAKTSVKLNLDFEKKIYFANITVRALIGNKVREIHKKQDVSLNIEPCQTCSRLAGHFFTTILQIRFDTRKLKKEKESKKIDIVNKKVKEINATKKNVANQVNIVKIKENKTGVDLYINDLKHSSNILQELKKDSNSYGTKYTKTLVGMESNGKRRYRYTMCVHFREEEEEEEKEEVK